MNKLLTTIILVFFSLTVFAQDKIADELKALSEDKKYDVIIVQYAPKSEDYSARSLYYIGLAYYMMQEDNNCIKFLDLSIGKDAKDPEAHALKASTLNYMGKYDQALKCFQAAIDLKPDDAELYSGLGDAYYSLEKRDLAIKAYTKATEQQKCPARPYLMIAQIYADLKNQDKALAAFYNARSKISKESDSYITALYNIGLFESLNGNYDKAEPAFVELIQLAPKDYHSYAKLIQIYYYRKDYEKAKPFKDKLYEAHKNGELKDNLEDMFCFDQFKWNDYQVQVFERFENENKGNIYNKHIFYVVDRSGQIVLRIQTEFSPISIELGGPKYLLCANKGATHFNPGIGFNDDLKYDNLKSAAIKLMGKYLN